MSGLSDILSSALGKQLIEGSSSKLGIDKETAATAMSAAIPMILGAMKNNASRPETAEGFLKAVSNERHSSPNTLDNLSSLLGGGGADQLINEGSKILGHLFGGQTSNAAGVLGKTSGLDANSASKLMQMAAPIVLGYLGKNAMQSGARNSEGISSLLGGLLGDQQDSILDSVSRVQDFDNNDSSIEDIAGMLMGGSKGRGGILGGLMNNLFK